MQTNAHQLIWHQIKLQMYKSAHGAKSVSCLPLDRLLCQLFHHRRLELRDGGDLHLLRRGVLAFDSLRETTVWVRNLANTGPSPKLLAVNSPDVWSALRSLSQHSWQCVPSQELNSLPCIPCSAWALHPRGVSGTSGQLQQQNRRHLAFASSGETLTHSPAFRILRVRAKAAHATIDGGKWTIS